MITSANFPYVLFTVAVFGAAIGTGFGVAIVFSVDHLLRVFDRGRIDWAGSDD